MFPFVLKYGFFSFPGDAFFIFLIASFLHSQFLQYKKSQRIFQQLFILHKNDYLVVEAGMPERDIYRYHRHCHIICIFHIKVNNIIRFCVFQSPYSFFNQLKFIRKIKPICRILSYMHFFYIILFAKHLTSIHSFQQDVLSIHSIPIIPIPIHCVRLI